MTGRGVGRTCPPLLTWKVFNRVEPMAAQGDSHAELNILSKLYIFNYKIIITGF